LRQYLEILSLPSEFSDKDNGEILKYLKEINFSPSQEIYRMRVMLVGPGSAGKTTLVHRLLTEEFAAGQFSMTDGISMKEWKLSGANDDVPPLHLQLSLWDFGGQEVYMNSHPMLFSDKTLYLLVWNPRSGIPLHSLEEYVLNIRSRAKSGSILLVTTHAEEVDVSVSRIQQSLRGLEKHDILSHHSVDSRTGAGIAELKLKIIDLVTREFAGYSRVLIPGWYEEVESRLREESEQKNRFWIDQSEFFSICSSVWPTSPPDGSDEDNIARVKTILELFHHWGVVYVLPDADGSRDSCGGDIVLNPQKLADVFKCVITCHTNTTRKSANNNLLFEEGILVHNRAGFVWPEEQYDPRLYSQFLNLFRDCELAYEMFDEKGAPSDRSLVPSLLPESSVLDEEELRARLLIPWDSPSSPPIAELKVKNQMISRGFVKISFDSLLSNFFPKLMVRLRHLSSVSECTRRRFVIRVSERVRDANGMMAVGWSVACVVEDKTSNSLVVYPGGCSYDATAMALQAIRGLLDDSFSGMCIEDLTFSGEGNLFSKAQILRLLKKNQPAILPLNDDDEDRDLKVSLSFLSCLFLELDSKQSIPSSSELCQFLDLSPADRQAISSLEALVERLSLPSPSTLDFFNLSHSLVKAIPIFRRCGLKLSSQPSILWLCGRSSSSFHVVGVSPSVVPTQSWECVCESAISFPISCSSIPDSNPESAFHSCPAGSALSGLLLASLRLLLPDRRLPDPLSLSVTESIEWVGVVDCLSQDSVLKSQGSEWFSASRDILGDQVFYSKAMLAQQRAQQGAVTLNDVNELFEEMKREIRDLRD
jgi:GTPase SAR1 family protein